MSGLLDIIGSHPASRPALEGMGMLLGYGELCEQVKRKADSLRGLHARTGGVMAITMIDSPAWIVTQLGCLLAEVPLLPIPPFFTEAQRRHALQDAGAAWLLDDGQAAPVATGISPRPFPAGTSLITYTSGSTRTPKGVCLGADHLETVASSLVELLGAQAGKHRTLLPLAVLLENIAGVHVSLLAGACCHVAPVAQDGPSIWQALESSQATTCILVPEMLKRLLSVRKPLPHLRFAAVGGAKVAPALLEEAHARGIPVFEGYGLSEAGSVIAVNTPEASRRGSVGRLLPHVRLHPASDGEIMIEHPRMLGYLGAEGSGEAGCVPNPYPTGDLGRIDGDGFLYLTGRAKNVLITGFGRNVFPEWVESELLAEPAIAQAMVFGDGEAALMAVIVARSAAEAGRAVEQANLRLPDYARVGRWLLADEPFTPQNGQLTGTGRPKRDAIAARYQSRFPNEAKLTNETGDRRHGVL
ncbi:AMP-binding protein [Skermanella aerolata]|nr:AMP-binding protein [Skermanella aerolata]KJB92827.1 AMP-dependent synthetase [Skermanella aerolata KACC 11604]